MDTIQITCALKDVPSFLGVYPSDRLPGIVHRTGTVIVNADPHTKEGSHWLAIRLEPGLSLATYFDSYGRPPSDPNILSFIRCNAAIWGYNSIPLQGPFTDVCGQYCCLFARFTDKRIPPLEFARLFPADGSADKKAVEMFKDHFGPVCGTPRGGQCCRPSLLQ